MKTLLFTLEFPPQTGGVSNYYHNLVINWPDKSNIEVLTVKTKKKVDFYSCPIYRQKLLFSKLRPGWLLALWQLGKILKQKKYSQVLIGQILPLGICAYLLSFLFNFKYTLIIHGMDWSWALNKKRKRFLTLKIIGRADKIICGNTYVEKLIKTELKKDFKLNLKTINPGVSLEKKEIDPKFQASLKTRHNLDDKLILLTIGRLVKRKGVSKVLESLASLKKEPTLKIKYIIAGSGPEEEILKAKAKNLSLLKENVIFLGEVSDLKKWSVLDLCDIFIMPTYEIEGDFEGFGIVYLEANLMNKPVIATKGGGVGDAVVNKVNGLLLDSAEPEEIKKAILKLAREENLKHSLGKTGRKRVLNEFSWSKKIKEFYSFLNT